MNSNGLIVNAEHSEHSKKVTAGKGFNLNIEVKAANDMLFAQRLAAMCNDRFNKDVEFRSFRLTKKTLTIPAKMSNNKWVEERTEQRMVMTKSTENSKPMRGFSMKNFPKILSDMTKGEQGHTIDGWREFHLYSGECRFQRIPIPDEDLKGDVLIRQNVTAKSVTKESVFLYAHPRFNVKDPKAIRDITKNQSNRKWTYETLDETLE